MKFPESPLGSNPLNQSYPDGHNKIGENVPKTLCLSILTIESMYIGDRLKVLRSKNANGIIIALININSVRLKWFFQCHLQCSFIAI